MRSCDMCVGTRDSIANCGEEGRFFLLFAKSCQEWRAPPSSERSPGIDDFTRWTRSGQILISQYGNSVHACCTNLTLQDREVAE